MKNNSNFAQARITSRYGILKLVIFIACKDEQNLRVDTRLSLLHFPVKIIIKIGRNRASGAAM